ncbi:MAG: phage tail protein [Candidatus Methanogaster sp.]|uniref:Phage tail protein n=1 Tax=Candidatus Methanogaster sp. TaxID=3386292 RepID=A0AC61L3L2_9EURY|nr:MAG: phage tail protein [ANME-2 cluster archaeon]
MRSDPYTVYNFLIEIDGIIAGGFTEVSGISIETEVETVTEGGANDIVYKLPKGTKYTDITLKHGLTDSDVLWKWYQDVIHGKIVRKNGTIYLRNQSGVIVGAWGFAEAYPFKWDGPAFNASSNTVATETIVLTHHGITRIWD